MSAGWDCEAYGPELRETGAVCFVAGELGKRVCGDQDECHQVMATERRRVFRRINELAADGSEAAVYLEGQFSSPAQLLGGGEEDDQEDGRS